MSEKNFVAYGDAESILTGYANRIKQSPTTFVGTQAQWNALSSSQKAEYELVDITDDEFSPSSFVDWESYGKLGAKNVCPICVGTTTLNGVTFTVNSDGTISATGTATEFTAFDIATTDMGYVLEDGNYILSDGLEEHSTDQYSTITIVDQNDVIHYDYANTKDVDNDAFTIANSNIKKMYIAICIGDGYTVSNLVFKPMIRLATDSNEIYQPYAMTNKELTKQVAPIDDMNNILGAKNLLPNKATTQVVNGITYTVNEDGSITADGTATSDASLYLAGVQSFGLYNLKKGQYILSDGNNGYSNEIYMQIHKYESPYTSYGGTRYGAKTFTLSEDVNVVVRIFIANGVTVSNLTFKPMLRPASIKDESYVPFVMTNKQLTDEAYDNHAWSVTFNGQWFVAMYAPGMKPTIYLNVPIKPSKALLTYSNLAVQYFNGSSWQNATINACNYNARLNAINISLDGIPDSFVSSHSNVLCSITGTFAIT